MDEYLPRFMGDGVGVHGDLSEKFAQLLIVVRG